MCFLVASELINGTNAFCFDKGNRERCLVTSNGLGMTSLMVRGGFVYKLSSTAAYSGIFWAKETEKDSEMFLPITFYILFLK